MFVSKRKKTSGVWWLQMRKTWIFVNNLRYSCWSKNTYYCVRIDHINLFSIESKIYRFVFNEHFLMFRQLLSMPDLSKNDWVSRTKLEVMRSKSLFYDNIILMEKQKCLFKTKAAKDLLLEFSIEFHCRCIIHNRCDEYKQTNKPRNVWEYSEFGFVSFGLLQMSCPIISWA